MIFLGENDPRYKVWSLCESPIEQFLCCALFTLLGCKAVEGPFTRQRLPDLADLAGEAPACFLFGQHEIGLYRADFLAVVVDPENRTHRRMVLECDGERYHGSEKQIERDRQRDEEIKEAGYRVVRYSGKHIHRDMPSILADVRHWIQASGAVCESPDDLKWYAAILSGFTPSRALGHERAEERDRYWREFDACEKELEPDFVTEGGEAGWWRDTL